MLRVLIAAFLVLHGLIHLLYFGQSWRLFELQPGMIWSEGSWVLSKLIGDDATRLLASISCLLTAIGFMACGTAVFVNQNLWRPVLAGAASFSSFIFALFWEGQLQKVSKQGGIGLLIYIAIIIAALILEWPDFGLWANSLSKNGACITTCDRRSGTLRDLPLRLYDGAV